MLRTLITGPMIPGGAISMLLFILLYSRVIAFSMSVPTRNRAVTIPKLAKLLL